MLQHNSVIIRITHRQDPQFEVGHRLLIHRRRFLGHGLLTEKWMDIMDGYYPPQYHPLPILPPQPYYYPQQPQRLPSNYRPREATPDRSGNYHNARESLNSSGARRQDATTSNTVTPCPTVRFEVPECSVMSTRGASHRQFK